jgi:hypothetical protein
VSTENQVDNDNDDTQVVDEQPGTEVLGMSDEDFLKLSGPPTVEAPAVAADAPADATKPADEEPGSTAEGKPAAADDAGDAGADGSTAPAGEPTSKAEPEASKPDPEKKVDEAKPAATEPPPINYEAEYKKLLAPFKANGKDIQVESVDDAINLMQMGANYNKKMAALKPNLKLMKMLENNGLLSEEKISFLIDVDKKVPGAIGKLVKESGIDPIDLDADKAGAYTRSSYAVDDREMELDTVLGDIQETPTYARILDVVSNKWDAGSKQVIAQAPQLLKVINGHMASGIYDLISAEVERERLFGRLAGMSDIDAYKHVGDAIQARGGFNHLNLSKSEPPGKAAPEATKPVIVQPKPKADDDKLNDKRRAASSPKPAPASTVPKDFNPLAMSDAEFAKLATPKFK